MSIFSITWSLFFPNTEKSAISFLVVGESADRPPDRASFQRHASRGRQIAGHPTGRRFRDKPLEGARVAATRPGVISETWL